MFTLPPPPLPTSYAQCRDTRPRAGQAVDYHDRHLRDLNPLLRDRLALVVLGLQEQGYQPVILEGYRSPARQDFLYQRGSTKARGCQSFHQYGLAVDIGFTNPATGRLDLRSTAYNIQAHQILGHLAQAEGLAWGGTYGDDGHIELRLPVFAHMNNVAVIQPYRYAWASNNTCQNPLFRYDKFNSPGFSYAIR